MRIDTTPGSSASLGLIPANANRSAAADSAATDSPAASDPFAGKFQPTADLLQLTAALDQLPSVRQEVVGDVAKRLGAGELTTPQARQQTVESILGSSPGHS